MTITSHPYRGQEDVPQMRELLVSRRASAGHGCWHVGDLVWRLFLHSRQYDLQETVRLWEDSAGNLLGFAIFSPPAARTGFELQVHPQARGVLEDQMLDWLEAYWRETMPASLRAEGETISRNDIQPETGLYTDVGVYDDDASQVAALERHGYVRTEPSGALLLRPLNEPIPLPSLPAGFTVHQVAGEHEVANRASAHREAFNSTRTTDEHYLRLMHTPGYTPELDLVAVAPDGTFGAFCIGWVDPVNKAGEFEPVGTRPAFRRQGLARAVLLEGLRRFKVCGAESAIVGPIDFNEDAARRLYRSIGFRAINTVHTYKKDML